MTAVSVGKFQIVRSPRPHRFTLYLDGVELESFGSFPAAFRSMNEMKLALNQGDQ